MENHEITIQQLTTKHHGILKAADLIKAGYSFKQIRRMTDSGILEKIGRGMYKIPGYGYDDRLEIARRIPTGVFCLFSACVLHQLSDFVPSELHLAVPKKSRYVLPVYPPVQLYFWEDHIYQLGIEEFALAEGKIRVYDPEKTVCDVLRLRGKLGMDQVKEVLKNYLLRPNRNIAKLYEYARLLRVEKPLNQFLTAML